MTFSILESIMVVFTTIFAYINRWNPNRSVAQATQNPYPFGTREWRAFADAQTTEHELMVMRIADLEAQVQQTTELAGSLEALAASQATLIHDLRRQNKALEEGPDPEVLQRIFDRIHTPLKNLSQPEPEPQPADPAAAGHDNTAVAPAAASAATPGPGRGPSQGMVTGHKMAARTRPMTLAEELEGHLGDDSEDDSEVDDA
ncbi:hypothetical protein KVR01_012328 [Diaporthe batatas]|uniref:uncharacterized protein n=1 Tax=Diaporthe batatas TaxID=748121 RepID=UPI001D04637A|nr:uncharacterized protein KVR01_012328 [Diaporthe batatas]KAG8157666.1 hypothetical protein KVR01_012328 [Diaporthe batatas]